MSIWLVVWTPLKNMSSSIGMINPNISGKIIQSCSRKTTNQPSLVSPMGQQQTIHRPPPPQQTHPTRWKIRTNPGWSDVIFPSNPMTIPLRKSLSKSHWKSHGNPLSLWKSHQHSIQTPWQSHSKFHQQMNYWLVVYLPLWDDYSQYMGKQKSCSSHHQPDYVVQTGCSSQLTVLDLILTFPRQRLDLFSLHLRGTSWRSDRWIHHQEWRFAQNLYEFMISNQYIRTDHVCYNLSIWLTYWIWCNIRDDNGHHAI